MKPVLMFAVSMPDAMAECKARNLVFKEVVWLKGEEYMPGVDLNEWEVIKTQSYSLREGEPA